MKLKLIRDTFTQHCTLGKLFIDDVEFCNTLEDVVRPVKIPGETAIPEGVFDIIIDKSTRFNRLMPHILNVPNFEGIRIHSGNTAADTEGCILIGLNRSSESIGQSHLAFDAFFPRLVEALKQGKVTIEITSANNGRGGQITTQPIV